MQSFKGTPITLKCKRYDAIVQVNAKKTPYFHMDLSSVKQNWTFKLAVEVFVI